ncbi:hypothetical protein K8R62_00485 [bacterium]|nr:hypothetical protein [bacterium]
MAKNQDENYQKKEKQKSLILFILMFLLFLLILVVGYFLFIYDFSHTKTGGDNKVNQQDELPDSFNNSNNDNNTNNNLNSNTIEIVANNDSGSLYGEEDLTEVDLKKLASSFAERFGSYSNQSRYDNLRDLKLFMSDGMKSWTDGFIEEQLSKEYSGEYYGISTKSVVATVDNFNPSSGVASATVQTQRIEQEEGKEDNVFYQDLKIDFVKNNKNWVVDEANWQ